MFGAWERQSHQDGGYTLFVRKMCSHSLLSKSASTRPKGKTGLRLCITRFCSTWSPHCHLQLHFACYAVRHQWALSTRRTQGSCCHCQLLGRATPCPVRCHSCSSASSCPPEAGQSRCFDQGTGSESRISLFLRLEIGLVAQSQLFFLHRSGSSLACCLFGVHSNCSNFIF